MAESLSPSYHPCYTTDMKLIVGLGNPGKKYELTRHNVGFLALDFFLKEEAQIEPKEFWSNDPLVRTLNLKMGTQKILFAQPQTFMNNSGKPVLHLANFYKLDLATDVLVLHDEVDLEFGKLRQTASSRAAGHNGVKSIIDHAGNQYFHRLRIGVESRQSRAHKPTDAFVLEPFTKDELAQLKSDIFPKINEKIKEFILQ